MGNVVGELTATVSVRGLWRLKAAIFVADAALRLVNWTVRTLRVKVNVG